MNKKISFLTFALSLSLSLQSSSSASEEACVFTGYPKALTGMSLADAQRLAEEQGLKISPAYCTTQEDPKVDLLATSQKLWLLAAQNRVEKMSPASGVSTNYLGQPQFSLQHPDHMN